jgi:hypothetical protein
MEKNTDRDRIAAIRQEHPFLALVFGLATPLPQPGLHGLGL